MQYKQSNMLQGLSRLKLSKGIYADRHENDHLQYNERTAPLYKYLPYYSVKSKVTVPMPPARAIPLQVKGVNLLAFFIVTLTPCVLAMRAMPLRSSDEKLLALTTTFPPDIHIPLISNEVIYLIIFWVGACDGIEP